MRYRKTESLLLSTNEYMSCMAFMIDTTQKLLDPCEVQWKRVKIPTLKAYYVLDGARECECVFPFRFFINVY